MRLTNCCHHCLNAPQLVDNKCRSSLLMGRNVRWPRRMLVSYGEYADGTDRRSPLHYVTLRFPQEAASEIVALF